MFEIEKIFSSGAGDALNTALAYRDGKNISAFGLCSFGKAAITALCANKAHSGVDDGPLLIVAGDFYLARAFYEQLIAEVRSGKQYLRKTEIACEEVL